MIKYVEVVICGSGTAGLSAAVWLARHGIRCTILESRSGPLKVGQADGVQCRTVEIFESLGIAEDVLREAYHVLEVAFWDDDEGHGIARTASLATNIVVGMRFPSAQVVRFCDAKSMQLVKTLASDGRWRIVIFAGDIRNSFAATRLQVLANYLEKGPVQRFTTNSANADSFIGPILVLSGERSRIEQEQIPEFFWPETGGWGMRDLHKTFVDDASYNSGHGHAYQAYGVDPENGAVVIVRPDQYVSRLVAFDNVESIGTFFDSWALPQK